MEFGKNLCLLLLLSVASVSCYPSRPLNDRPSELAWQAWLLVDSQNQMQNESDRRITPKSVFIAPKLGQRNDSLPDCADGYRPDAMGRCIKSIKVDEAAHLDFLLKRLNEMYAEQSEELEEAEESMPTAGPLQVNIPLGQSEEIPSKPDVSLIPTINNGQFDDKVSVKRHPDAKISEKQVPNVEQLEEPPPSNVNDYEDLEEDTEADTETTTIEITTEIPTTIPTTEFTTETTEFVTESETTVLPNADDTDLKALFFLMPTNKTSNLEKQLPKEESPNKEIKSESMVIEEYASDEPHTEIQKLTLFTNPVEQDRKLNFFRFPLEENIKFPEENNDEKSELLVDNTKVYYDNNPGIHKPQNRELTPSQIQELFKQYAQRPVQIPHERIFNHRNRDRNENLWNLQPNLRSEEVEKPLVLRFGRYPSPYYSQPVYSQKHLPQHHNVQYYGEEAAQAYSNVYGRKRRRGNLR